jgi:hypothetical protein
MKEFHCKSRVQQTLWSLFTSLKKFFHVSEKLNVNPSYQESPMRLM